MPKSEHKRLNGVVIYIFWNIWKERNRRIFNNEIETVPQVAARIKEDIEQKEESTRLCLAAVSPWGVCFPPIPALGGFKPSSRVSLLVQKLSFPILIERQSS